MKVFLCILLLLETFVFVVQQQVDRGLSENEISQQLSLEDRRQNQPQTDTRTHEASTDSQFIHHVSFYDIHAALTELIATVTEQKANIRALETRLSDAEKTAEEQKVILEELNKTNHEVLNLTQSQVEELRKEDRGIFTAPLKGAYMFNFSVFGFGNPSYSSTASIMKNGERVVVAHGYQDQYVIGSTKGVVLILEVGDVVYVSLWSQKKLTDNQANHNTFSGYLLFPLREQEPCRM
ncbi:complement C1q 2 isoform X2 [Labeo rohita]|uniref:Complement C1q 2 isoform X2 n=1 Tax=Labeo rohita TaxID=84645 RepID=A0A498M082_LABRO|nr:complement C1q 2 isoform X2 [Labeo rohita]